MPILKSQAKPNTPAKSGAPNKAAKSKDVFAQKYAESEAGQGSGWVPPDPGTYNATVTEGQYTEDDQKTGAYIEVQIEDDGDMNGKSARIYWNFTDENGDDKGGMPFFKSNMQMFGRAEDFTSKEEAADFLAELATNETKVIIDVKGKGSINPKTGKSKYTNIYLNSVPEVQ